MNRSRQQKGMTLLELMIVVAIIGILASIAIPSFKNYQLTSRTAEAKANLGALGKTQLAYFAEFGAYVSVPSEPFTGLGVPPQPTKRNSASVGPAFALVGWVPEGDVFYDYDTLTDADGVCGCTLGPCFTASAYGDLDGNAAPSKYSYGQPNSAGQMCPGVIGVPPARPNEPYQDTTVGRF